MLFYAINISVLSVKEIGNPADEIFFPVEEEEEFTLVYTHSVDLLPVYEVFYPREGSIYLKETYFYNFGAGMGLLQERGEYREEGDLLKIININEKIEPFILKTGPIAQHRLIFRDQEIPILDYFKPHTPLQLKIRKIKLWQYGWLRIAGLF